MTNLKTTIKTLSIAAAVSFSMNAMANPATIVNMPGFVAGSDANLSASLGQGSIDHMAGILTGVANTGGSVMSTAQYWNLFVGNSADWFDYQAAKPAIEEYIFTTSGRVWNGTQYMTGDKSTHAEFGSSVNGGTGNDSSATWIGGTLVANSSAIRGVFSGLSLASSQAEVTFSAEVASLDNVVLNDVGTDVTVDEVITGIVDDIVTLRRNLDDANIDSATFDRANALLAEIASHRTQDNKLNVEAATADLEVLIGHHNTFLVAKIKQQAELLKAGAQGLAIHVAGGVVAESTRSVCEAQASTYATGSVIAACTKIGDKFVSLASLSAANPVDIAAYNVALGKIGGLATDIVNFDNVVGSFDATTAAANIRDEFGTITAGISQDTAGNVIAAATGGDFSDLNLVDELGNSSDFHIPGFDSELSLGGTTNDFK